MMVNYEFKGLVGTAFQQLLEPYFTGSPDETALSVWNIILHKSLIFAQVTVYGTSQ